MNKCMKERRRKLKEKRKRKAQQNNEGGITLVSLIITIVILIILAAVTINVTLGDGGLIQQAQHAAEVTVNSTKAEQEQIASLEQELANILAEDSEITPPEPGGNNETGEDIEKPEEPSIPETETQVANYADVDGNGTVDGVIYADLAIGGSGQWNPSGNSSYNSYGTYTIPKGSGFKKYRVTQESYSGSLGTGQVIAPVNGSSGNERFYVMALSNVDSSIHQFWSGSTSVVTSTDFGTGESNTAAMKATGSTGMWEISAVQNGTWNGSSGWYVPSRGEWAAFASQLDITSSNYSSKGLSDHCWSSSQSDTNRAWCATFNYGYMYVTTVGLKTYVRLGTTF